MVRHRSAVLLALLAATACSKSEPDRTAPVAYEPRESDVAADRAQGAAPGVSVTAAPGVAFNYRYAFRLANLRIGAVQERHAQMCERLTIARCRITGMRYTLDRDGDVSAALDLKLDPAVARDFGKNATQAVTEAEGLLVDQEITGVDVGSGIAAARRSEAAVQTDIASVEQQLRQTTLNAETRASLTARLSDLRAELRDTQAKREDAEQTLATTPMHFDYGSGGMIPGFDARSPIRHAFEQAGASAIGAVALLIILIGALLPWGIAALGVFGLWRFIAPRWRRRFGARPDPEAPIEN